MNAKKEIGNRIRSMRKGLKMNQHQLAEAIGVSNTTLSAYEKGDAFPSLEILFNIVRVGGVTFDWLFTGSEAVKEEKPAITYPLGEKEEKAIHAAEDLLGHYGLEKRYAIVEIHHPPPQDERLSEDEKQLLNAYRCASDEIREEAFGMLERSARRSQGSGGGENGLIGKKSA